MDRDTLADFLRGRREALSPTDVGLPSGPGRRAPGLRREEVAQISGMSVDYYARLEQRRSPQPSTNILSALARTLRLSRDERDYLYRIAGHHAPGGSAPSSFVRPALIHLLTQLDDCAAFVVSDLEVMLAQNRLSVLLMGDRRAKRQDAASSMTWQWFIEPKYRELYPPEDHDEQSRVRVADLRATWSRRRADADVAALVDGLLVRSQEFRSLWDRQDVEVRHAHRKTLTHHEVGRLTVECELLATYDDGQRLVILSADPTSESYSKLQLLGVVGDHKVGTVMTPDQ
ncbi:helix-turn-helix transcriptional regulator [Mycolicibacterium sp. XJ870]